LGKGTVYREENFPYYPRPPHRLLRFLGRAPQGKGTPSIVQLRITSVFFMEAHIRGGGEGEEGNNTQPSVGVLRGRQM